MVNYFICMLLHLLSTFTCLISHVMLKTTMWNTDSSVASESSLIIQEVRGLTQSGHRSSDSWHLTWPPVGKHPLPRSITASCRAMRKTGNPRSVSGLDCLPMSLSPDTSGFWEKQYLATDVIRDQGPGISGKRQEGSPLERSAETGRTLPASVLPFLLLLVLPWCWEQKEKNEGLGPISLSLSRKLRYSLSRNNMTLLNRSLCSFLLSILKV